MAAGPVVAGPHHEEVPFPKPPELEAAGTSLGAVSDDRRDVLSPRDAAAGSTDYVPDERLPLLAAAWLAEGWDSEALVELASMSASDARAEARRLLPTVLDSLGVSNPYSAADEAAARYAAKVAWAVREMDSRFVPYSAAQKLLETVDDEPQLFDGMPGTQALRQALRAVDAVTGAARDAEQERLRRLLLDLAERLGVQR